MLSFYGMILAVLSVPTQQVEMRVLLQQALDAVIQSDIVLEDVKIADLFAIVEEKTGVDVVMPLEVMALLPYGSQTTIDKAEIRGVSLREGLVGLIGGLGMTFVVNRDHIEVIPKPGLYRIGRPACWAELDTLGRLPGLKPGVNNDDLESLKPLMQFHVPDQNPWGVLTGAIRNVGAGPGDEVLEAACNRLGWTWHPKDDRIVVLTRQAQISRQLQTLIRVNLDRRPLLEFMQAIGRACGVNIKAEPGALATVPHDLRYSFSFTVEGYTAAEALEALAAPTGLGYLITPNGVLFYEARQGTSPATVAAGAPPPQDDPVIGVIPVTINGQTIELLLRASDVPPEVRALLDEAKGKVIESLIRAGSREGDKP